MRGIIVSLIATAAIVTSMSHAASAATRHNRHTQASETARDTYGSIPEENAPASIIWGNSRMGIEDPRTASNGN